MQVGDDLGQRGAKCWLYRSAERVHEQNPAEPLPLFEKAAQTIEYGLGNGVRLAVDVAETWRVDKMNADVIVKVEGVVFDLGGVFIGVSAKNPGRRRNEGKVEGVVIREGKYLPLPVQVVMNEVLPAPVTPTTAM